MKKSILLSLVALTFTCPASDSSAQTQLPLRVQLAVIEPQLLDDREARNVFAKEVSDWIEQVDVSIAALRPSELHWLAQEEAAIGLIGDLGTRADGQRSFYKVPAINAGSLNPSLRLFGLHLSK